MEEAEQLFIEKKVPKKKDVVLDMIKRSKDGGINMEALAERTGYTKTVVGHYLTEFRRSGKITKVGSGNYVKWVAVEYAVVGGS